MKEYVLITGATSGIGYEFAKIFAENKYNLILSGRNIKVVDVGKGDEENDPDVAVAIEKREKECRMKEGPGRLL